MLRELLSQRSTRVGGWIHGVVDGHLSVLVIQPCVDILAALLQYLLS